VLETVLSHLNMKLLTDFRGAMGAGMVENGTIEKELVFRNWKFVNANVFEVPLETKSII